MNRRTAQNATSGSERASGPQRAVPASGKRQTVAGTARNAVPVEGQTPRQTGANALCAADRSGWPSHPGERRDFDHRIRAFPAEVAAWRRRLLSRVASDPGRFPRAESASSEQLHGWLDEGISYLREVARILAVLYGTPDPGNKPDPTDTAALLSQPDKWSFGGI